LLDAIRRGQKVINYTGHGSATIWKDFVFTADDATALNNRGACRCFVMMTCLNGYFLGSGIDFACRKLDERRAREAPLQCGHRPA